MQHQTMENLTHNHCLSYMYMYLRANATSAVHKHIPLFPMFVSLESHAIKHYILRNA